MGPAVKIWAGEIHALWESHAHQQQFSIVKADVRSHVHLSLVGVSCTFHLMVLKADNEEKPGLLISVPSSNVQTTGSIWSSLQLTGGCCETCLWFDLALTWCFINLKSAQHVRHSEDNKPDFLTLRESYKTSQNLKSLKSSSKM